MGAPCRLFGNGGGIHTGISASERTSAVRLPFIPGPPGSDRDFALFNLADRDRPGSHVEIAQSVCGRQLAGDRGGAKEEGVKESHSGQPKADLKFEVRNLKGDRCETKSTIEMGC